MCLVASNGGSWSQALLAWTAEKGVRMRQLVFSHVLAFRKQHNLRNAELCGDCFAPENRCLVHLSHRRTCCSWHATLNDVERFRNGLFHECDSPKARQMCKVHREIWPSIRKRKTCFYFNPPKSDPFLFDLWFHTLKPFEKGRWWYIIRTHCWHLQRSKAENIGFYLYFPSNLIFGDETCAVQGETPFTRLTSVFEPIKGLLLA